MSATHSNNETNGFQERLKPEDYPVLCDEVVQECSKEFEQSPSQTVSIIASTRLVKNLSFRRKSSAVSSWGEYQTMCSSRQQEDVFSDECSFDDELEENGVTILSSPEKRIGSSLLLSVRQSEEYIYKSSNKKKNASARHSCTSTLKDIINSSEPRRMVRTTHELPSYNQGQFMLGEKTPTYSNSLFCDNGIDEICETFEGQAEGLSPNSDQQERIFSSEVNNHRVKINENPIYKCSSQRLTFLLDFEEQQSIDRGESFSSDEGEDDDEDEQRFFSRSFDVKKSHEKLSKSRKSIILFKAGSF